MRQPIIIVQALIMLLVLVGNLTYAADSEYPGRKIYLDTPLHHPGTTDPGI